METVTRETTFFSVCGARYKTRPGLTYHLTHVHKKAEEAEEAPSPEVAPDLPDTDEGIYLFSPSLCLPASFFFLSIRNRVSVFGVQF